MKYSEFHRIVRRNGWIWIRTEGSHYIYCKNGETFAVPFHGPQELGKGLEMKLRKQMKLK